MAPSATFLPAAVLASALCIGFASSGSTGIDDTSILMQQGMRGKLGVEMNSGMEQVDRALDDMKLGVNKLLAGTAEMLKATSQQVASKVELEPVSLIEEDLSAVTPIKPLSQRVSELKEKAGERMNKVVTGINKGVSDVNARVERNVGSMMSRANSAVDDIHSAASNALQGMKDFTDAASEPISKKVNAQSSKFNSKTKLMINKINRAIDDMKVGMHDLAHGITDGMKEASEKIAAQLAQSVHEHVRQEIELARAAEPASLLEVETLIDGGAAAAKAQSAVAVINSAATHALDGMKGLIDTAGAKLLEDMSEASSEVRSEVGDMLGRTEATVGEAKAGMRDLARSAVDSIREASEKVAAELTRAAHQELDLAKASV